MKTHNETKFGSVGWVGIAAYVYLFDKFSEESLTHAVTRGLENPRCRPAVVGAIGYTACHLVNVLPRDYDLFYRFVDISRDF